MSFQVFTLPGKSNSGDQEQRGEEETAVDMDPKTEQRGGTQTESQLTTDQKLPREARRDETDLAEETKRGDVRETKENEGRGVSARWSQSLHLRRRRNGLVVNHLGGRVEVGRPGVWVWVQVAS